MMRKLILLTGVVFILTNVITSAIYAEEAEKEKEFIGITFGIDYHSMYLWRGTYLFSEDGAVLPYIRWDIFDTGLSLMVFSELSMSWFINGFQKIPDEYYLDRSTGALTKKKLKNNQSAYSLHSLAVVAAYSYTIKKAVSLGTSYVYMWHYNAPGSYQLGKTRIDGVSFSAVNNNYFCGTVTIGFPIVPFINPEISITVDWYPAMRVGGDFYPAISFRKDFELTKNFKLHLGISGGYFYYHSGKDSYLYITTSQTIGVKRTSAKKGFSDITPKVSLTFTQGGLTINAGFNWVIVPAKSWYKGDNVHRYFANLGIAYKI
jgi:hypothetical protein